MTPAIARITGADVLPLPRRRYLPEARTKERRRFLSLPLGLIGTIAMITVIESGIARRGPLNLDPVCFSWIFSAAAARHEAVDAEILCLGDSLAKHGFIPSLIERATGRRTYNLAVAAGPVSATEILLRRSLNSGARPSAIVFDMKPGLLAGGPRYRVRQWQEFLSPGELSRFLFSGHGADFATELALGYLLPSFRSRHEIRAGVLELANGQSSRLAALHAICTRNWTVNAGANLARPMGNFRGEVSEAEHEAHVSSKFAAQSFNAASARRLVALAASRGIRPYLVIPPMTPAILDRQRTSGASTKYENFLKTLQVVNPDLTVLDARESGYPPELFIDPIHLDTRGAVALSSQVGAFLKADFNGQSQAAKRWVRLPEYRAVAIPPGLEDVEQSRVILGIPVQR